MTDKPKKKIWSRRDFLMQSGGGMAGLALASLMNDDKVFAQDATLNGGQCSGHHCRECVEASIMNHQHDQSSIMVEISFDLSASPFDCTER